MTNNNKNHNYKTHSNRDRRAAEEERDLITEYPDETKPDIVSCIAWAGVGFFAGIVLCNFLFF